MDTTIAAGSTLILHASGRRVALKVLTSAVLPATPVRDDGDAVQVRVLGPAEAVSLGVGEVEVVTASGVVRMPAQVVTGDGMSLLLGPVGSVTQRRREVRGDVELPLRLTLPGPSQSTLSPVQVVRGHTRNLSAGGFLAVLDSAAGRDLAVGQSVHVEVQLPQGRLTGWVQVVEVSHFGLRAAFQALDQATADRIARLVFAQERERLAARRRQADGGTTPGRHAGW